MDLEEQGHSLVFSFVGWGGTECQKVVKETPQGPEFPELCADLSP